jgi:excisionase family DNA binding protein
MLGKKGESHAQKVLDVDANFQGNLTFKDAVNLHINGNFEGRLETKGDLLIGEHASVRANIIGERITIAGAVTGDVTALNEIRLMPTSRLVGNIKTPSFMIERGAVFQGSSQMLAQGEGERGVRRLFLNLDEVAQYLSVEKSLVAEWAKSGQLEGIREGEGWRFDKERVDSWVENGRLK